MLGFGVDVGPATAREAEGGAESFGYRRCKVWVRHGGLAVVCF